MDAKHHLSAKEISSLFADPTWAAKFPPILSVDQAAELAQVPKNTIYTWSSQGLLKDCSFRAGKYRRFVRNRFAHRIINEGINET